jgi:hypothetical protein
VIRLWNLDSASWARKACEIVGRNMSRMEWDQFIGTDVEYHRTCSQFRSSSN